MRLTNDTRITIDLHINTEMHIAGGPHIGTRASSTLHKRDRCLRCPSPCPSKSLPDKVLVREIESVISRLGM
jgi:hypothetical protein